MRYNTNEHKEKRFRIILNCMLISGLSVFAQLYLFQPMLSELQASFGVSLATGSLAVSASTIGMATGLFLFAFKADTFKRERLMSLSLILSALLTITSAFMSHFVLLLLLNFLKGIALSGVSAVALAYLSDEIEPGKIGLAISLYLSGNTIGGMTGRVAGSLLAGWGGWQQAVWVIGITSLLLGFLFYWKIPISSQVSQNSISIREKLQQMRDLLSKRLFIGMYLIAALAMGVFVSVYNYISIQLESPRYGLPHQMIAMIFVMYLTGVAGSIIVGKLSDKYRPERLLRYSLILLGAGLSMLLIPRLWALIAGLGVLTFAFFSTHTIASRIVSVNASRSKSSATSIYWLSYYAGSSIIGSLTGIILTRFGWDTFVEILLMLTTLSYLISSLATGSFHISLVFHNSSEKSLSSYD
ncbi:MAG TPA: MFS transporter [Candidatus Parabacteroides intestinipullorum]|uniref:MFS transporter n=1 Tax=Candidatus Parabacteroides intestinipullorum TaxID=2838723 RepID=A0A9D2BFY9_9BACT|nr:MFS transporter [Candidatus Parabacteroides intestinipullorum]